MSDQVLSTKYNIYGAITEKIARAIREPGTRYVMPWHSGDVPLQFPVNAVTDNAYRGVNILSLWVDATRKGFASGYWASYRQWQSVGAQVRYGERGSLIVFYRGLDPDEEGEESAPRFVAKASWIFNAAQVDGWTPPAPRPGSAVAIDGTVKAFVEAVDARIEHNCRMARYRLDIDTIEMPNPAWFFDTPTRTASEAYHAVLCHELVHWTGPSHRLDRVFGKRFGDTAYAFEELVAELGAAFLCSAFRIANEPRPDHAAYVGEWLKVLGNDPKALFTAAHKAQEAIEYLVALAGTKLDGDPIPA